MIDAGSEKMACSVCGNNNVNEMLVEFFIKHPLESKKPFLDTTTLPKFLYYLQHPQKLGEDTGGTRITEIRRVICDAEDPWEGEQKPNVHEGYQYDGPPDPSAGKKPFIEPTILGI